MINPTPVPRPKASSHMVENAKRLRQAADRAEAGELESICLVFVERGPERFVTTIRSIDSGPFTMVGALVEAQRQILLEDL